MASSGAWPTALGDAQDNRFFERFFAAEAALAGGCKHPNVVQIFDAVFDDPAPHLVMEYVSVTLRRYCRADALLPLDQIVEVGFKCAMALGYVYRQGVIHRDVKPGQPAGGARRRPSPTSRSPTSAAPSTRLRRHAGVPRRLAGLHVARAARRRRTSTAAPTSYSLWPRCLPPDRRPPPFDASAAGPSCTRSTTSGWRRCSLRDGVAPTGRS